jgi:3',5'-cyclic AMP phosphodiesterase CpdA
MSVLRVWNLRRGDADDDRLSPYAGGLRKLFVAAVFEFNYLKAPVGFLFLVIGPALIVGVAPSLVVTYGHLVFHTTNLAETNLVVILCFLAVLLGAAFWIGRPLLTKALLNFRHLQYTLVFPIFVALRELLRTGAERLAGSSTTPERLGRIRQIATALASLLFATGGLALTIGVEVSFGLKLVNVEHVRIWAVVGAALGNAAVILGLSTAIESLHWFWREVTVSGPALDWVPGPPQAASSVFRIAHLSDLHIVGERYGYRMEAGTHGPRGNRCFRNTLRKLAAVNAKTPLDCVLVTGDITDAGTRAEWAEFTDLLRTCPELRKRLSLVPGNHDVNIVDRANPGRLDLPWSAGQALRKLRFLLALDAAEGDRVRLVDHASGALGPLLKDYLRESGRLQLLRTLAQRGSLRGRWEMAKAWDAIFPLIEPPPREESYGLILLDSNAASHFSLTNAIGVVNPSQLKALKSVLRRFPRSAWIILLHHSVVEYPDTSISLKDRIGLALVNAPDVLAAVTPYASHVIVLHGHRHMDWIGTWRDLVLCSAPSVALGASGDEKFRGSFHVHELALVGDGGIRLLSTQRIEVAR